ncbi:DNA topoisomerase I, archaeal [Thermoplasmatales archaeon SCGC AB-539-N05]|nr:DNA topoisomerase I, archaeal [Thermoplasmatales archaeon SCGC AB-539-N05]
MKLVICEKNIAARRIAYILSGGKSKSINLGKTPVYEFAKDGDIWKIVGLRGHIINLDYPVEFNRWNGILPRELIDVEPYKKVSERNIAASLKSLVDKNPFIIVATDFDREGELIGVEAINLIKEYNKDIDQIKRAKFSAITNNEIKNAFDNLEEVDYNLSDAGESRQIIDLAWGAVLTRFISLTAHRLGKDFLSIGRVQSPTLALLVEREKEIQKFEPKTYWKIIAALKKDKSFDATHIEGQFWDEKQAKGIYEKVKDAETATVKKADKKTEKELPPAPFSTTTFLQSASYLGISTANAMSIAEELYMMGLTSYPRTDNTVYPPSLNLKGILQKLANSLFSKETNEVISNGRKYPMRGKKQTTDHPPIHPVGVPSGKNLTSDQQKIYELICRRFLATLAKDAISETMDVLIDISGEDFKASGYRLIEPNWKNIYTYFKEKRKPLPKLSEGEKVKISEIKLKEDQTKPPKRYTQGSLIAKMEQLSLGTKSTRHEIINKLNWRKYITLKPFAPTLIAIAVIDALSDCDVTKPKMTAVLEKDMSAIAEGKKTLNDTVKESRQMLTEVMNELEKDKEEIKTSIKNAHNEQNAVGKCPKCGKRMIIRTSRKGKRFVGCTGFPDCKNTYSLPQNGGIVATGKVCNMCGTPVVKVITKGKRPWELCLNSECSAKKPERK